LRKESLAKSAALSKGEVMTSGGEAAEALTVSVGAYEEALGGVMTVGVEEAKRIPALFCIKRFVLENRDFMYVLEIDVPFLEASGLCLKGAFCTIEEEN
jgi:hypothetical protein